MNEALFSKSYMDEMIQEAAQNITRQRDEFIIKQIEKVAGKFEHEWQLMEFIKHHCRLERHPGDRTILFIDETRIIEWKERIVNKFDFETGTATVTLEWNY